jgi:hypothetical protein
MGECWELQSRSIDDAPDNVPEMMKYKCCNVTNHRMAHTPKMAHFEANQPLHLNISTPHVVIKAYNS